MSLNLTIEAFTTPYHENITHEYAPTERQLKRASEVKDLWQHTTIHVHNIPEETTIDELLRLLVSEQGFPRWDSEGEVIRYCLAPFESDAESVASENTGVSLLFALPSILAALSPFDTLANQGVEDEDTLTLYPGLLVGGPDPFTIAASVAAVAQVLLMVVDMWSRARSATPTVVKSQKPVKAWEGMRFGFLWKTGTG